MKGVLEFDLNDVDDIISHKRCVKSDDMALALWNIYYSLGKSLQRKLENDPTSTDKDYELLEFVNAEISDIFNNHGILISELIN